MKGPIFSDIGGIKVHSSPYILYISGNVPNVGYAWSTVNAALIVLCM